MSQIKSAYLLTVIGVAVMTITLVLGVSEEILHFTSLTVVLGVSEQITILGLVIVIIGVVWLGLALRKAPTKWHLPQ